MARELLSTDPLTLGARAVAVRRAVDGARDPALQAAMLRLHDALLSAAALASAVREPADFGVPHVGQRGSA